jgi:hypothetical protein
MLIIEKIPGGRKEAFLWEYISRPYYQTQAHITKYKPNLTIQA